MTQRTSSTDGELGFSTGGLTNRPLSSPLKCNHVPRVNKNHAHDQSLLGAMPGLVVDNESENEDEETTEPVTNRRQIIAEVHSRNRLELESFSYIRGKV